MPEFTRRTQIFQQVHWWSIPGLKHITKSEADDLHVTANADVDLRLHQVSCAPLL